jgi:hypothetical protein
MDNRDPYDLDYESAIAFREEVINRLHARLERIKAANAESKRKREQKGDAAS